MLSFDPHLSNVIMSDANETFTHGRLPIVALRFLLLILVTQLTVLKKNKQDCNLFAVNNRRYETAIYFSDIRYRRLLVLLLLIVGMTLPFILVIINMDGYWYCCY